MTSATSFALPNYDGESPPVMRSTQKGTNNDYTELKYQLKQRGLLNKQPVYYTCWVALLFSLLVVGVGALLVVHVPQHSCPSLDRFLVWRIELSD